MISWGLCNAILDGLETDREWKEERLPWGWLHTSYNYYHASILNSHGGLLCLLKTNKQTNKQTNTSTLEIEEKHENWIDEIDLRGKIRKTYK